MRFVALGSALAAGGVSARNSGLGVSWWANGQQAELSLLYLEGGVLRELWHAPTPLRMAPQDWAQALAPVALSPREVAWWVGSHSDAGAAGAEGMGQAFPRAKGRWLAAQRVATGLVALGQGALSLAPIMGSHLALRHPHLMGATLSAHQGRPGRLHPRWRLAPLPLSPVYLVSQAPLGGPAEVQAWWWCALAVDGDRALPPSPAWVFPDHGLPVQVANPGRLPGEGLWLRCDGSEVSGEMRAWLLAVDGHPQEAMRRAHLAAHALWPVAELGEVAWPAVHAAWVELMRPA